MRQKLAAARRVLGDLERSLQEFDAAPSWRYDIVAGENRADPRYLFREGPFAAADEWEDHIGTVGYRCRSALDNLVTAIVVAHGKPEAEHRGGFPIYTEQSKYLKKSHGVSRRDILLAGVPEPARLLIDAMQPFTSAEPSQHPLARLNSVRNPDNHWQGAPSFAGIRGYAFVHVSPRTQVAAIFTAEVQAGPSGTDRRLRDGDDLLSVVVPAQMAAAEDALIKAGTLDDPDGQLTFVPRIGVGFGPAGLYVFELFQIVDFIEHRVVAQLEPWVTHDAS